MGLTLPCTVVFSLRLLPLQLLLQLRHYGTRSSSTRSGREPLEISGTDFYGLKFLPVT